MSITVQQILSDAKRLVNRLRDHDITADGIISQTQALYKNVDAMKEYNEDLADQNITSQLRAYPLLVFNVQQENKHIKELQEENRELRIMLEEHQSVLELIMSKYRQQVTHLVQTNSMDNAFNGSSISQELQKKADDICELAAKMKQSVETDEKNYTLEQERLIQLITENNGLKELLKISQSSGSLLSSLACAETVDKDAQTEI